mmetsp:Transcript_7048/g.16064  ORF Transcript_7048/g.16064 Transcript_7048/m.16064 type:complete len:223 (+) Transcript_7048:278-946(+)
MSLQSSDFRGLLSTSAVPIRGANSSLCGALRMDSLGLQESAQGKHMKLPKGLSPSSMMSGICMGGGSTKPSSASDNKGGDKHDPEGVDAAFARALPAASRRGLTSGLPGALCVPMLFPLGLLAMEGLNGGVSGHEPELSMLQSPEGRVSPVGWFRVPAALPNKSSELDQASDPVLLVKACIAESAFDLEIATSTNRPQLGMSTRSISHKDTHLSPLLTARTG